MSLGFMTTATPPPRSQNSTVSLRFDWLDTQLSATRALSPEQIEIFRTRHAGASYTTIQSMFSLSNPTALTRCLVRTALGLFWCHYHAERADCC
jgi:hypothetical protein